MGLQFIEVALALFLIIYFQNFNLSKTKNLEKKNREKMDGKSLYKFTGNFIETLSPLCDTGLMYKITCG